MKKKYLIKYSFEFVVIVIGISVSFWLNEISIGNQNEEERIKVLNSLSIEAAEIKKYCDERVDRWDRDREILRMFLNTDGQKFNIDSITKLTTSKGSIEFNLIYYRVFEPPMNRYYSIINAGTLKYVESDKIKEILSRLHNTFLSYVETTIEYEKLLKEDFVSYLFNESKIRKLTVAQNNKKRKLLQQKEEESKRKRDLISARKLQKTFESINSQESCNSCGAVVNINGLCKC